jgi:hypothetical protein
VSEDDVRHLNVFIDSCTCGSGKVFVDCCFAPLDTRPPGAPTGYAHPACYARELGDCSPSSSREHFVSRNILDLLGPGQAQVQGLHWLQPGETKLLDPRALATRVLCERHNNALSPLDALAGRFFRFVRGDETKFTELVIPGYELERWMLKVLCGIMVKGMGTVNCQQLDPMEPKLELNQTLFERAAIPEGCGLSYLLEEQPAITHESLELYVMSEEPVGVFGLGFRLGYFRLLFTLAQVTSTPKGDGLPGLNHHPKCIVITGHGPDREVHFGWPEGKAAYLNITAHG